MKPIRFPKGCEMSIYLPLVLLTGGSKTAIEEGEVTNVAVSLSRYGVKTACTPTLFENFIVIQLPATLSAGAYVIEYTFKYDGRKVSGSIANVLEIVSDNAQSNWENYVSDGKAYLSDQIFVAGALLTDAEIAAKKAQYEAATAAANVAKASYEASKAAFDQKAENIDALGDMAKQTTLTAGITNIRADIAGIEVDVPSDVARESSPKYIENAVDELDTKVGNVQDGIGDIEDKISETVGSDPDGETVHAKLDSFATELDKIGSPAEGQPTTLFAAIAAGGSGGGGSTHTTDEVYAQLQTIINANIMSANYDGYTFMQGYYPLSFTDARSKMAAFVTSVYDDKITEALQTSMFQSFAYMKECSLPNLLTMSNGQVWFGTCTRLEYVSIPKVQYFSQTYLMFTGDEKLRFVDFGSLNSLGGNLSNTFQGCNNLIDIKIGELNMSTNWFASWNPTNALLTDSTSLVDEGETFASNREKLLYNIREHIAARIASRVGQSALTLTMHANIKAAINADAATAAAFTSKNWTIA